MNNKNIFSKALALTTIAMSLTACSDSFLEEKKNYGNFNQTTAYSDYNGAQERLNNLYYWLLPTSRSGDGNGTNSPNDWTSVGNPDKWSKSTDEYGGFSIFVNPEEEVTYNFTGGNFDFFYVANDVYSPWGHIRNCNDIIENVEKSSLTEQQKNEILGQAYFFRGYMYYHLVTIYGGVPIVDHVQDPILGTDGDGSNLIEPRRTTKECVDFICKDFKNAANMLPDRWQNEAQDFGRITSGLAQAMLGKMLLYYASPVFNRSDDVTRWEAAYTANKTALEKLKAGNFGLAYPTSGGEKNGANWAKMWMDYTGSDGSVNEAVFITLHNTKANVSGQPDYGKYNNWEHSIRPRNTNGGGGYTPTAEMVDLFPMADGLKPGESKIPYDKLNFWLNRDPRFYRTFAFPGVEWQWSEGGVSLTDPSLSGIIPTDVYTTGKNYALWSYMWNDNEEDLAKVTTSSGYWPELLTQSTDKGSSHSIYVRKRTDDLHLHTSPFYEYINSQSNPKGFMKNAAPLLTMRYAEVLLNFAEAACGANHYDEAVKALEEIRARVGYTASNNYGLPTDISSDRAKLFAAILYERQIELAYEGHRYNDMHRWMLFDGGQGQSAIKPSWALTGFGGNTCTYLGVKPLNGTKRHQIILYCLDVSETDPTEGNRPEKALTLDEDMSYINGTYNDDKVRELAEFYEIFLGRKDVNLDGNDDALTINYRPTYYFLGLRQNAMQTNPTLHQTVGWHDLGRNADGLFDPLSDTVPE
ncbi:MAG: RagB/SusD family nutrient uptake outer membrane protein [Prevotella sp.]|nr:RagB/SusD family nutrient uptake outer membrane protein [Prevotella sp.]